MNPDEHKFKHRELTSRVIGAFYDVYNELGHGFLESVYQASLEIAIRSLEIKVLRKIEIPVSFRGHQVGIFEADMIVNDVLLLELKAVRTLDSTHEAQLLNYLRATPIEIGLLMNFGVKPEFKRFIFDNARKQLRGERRLGEELLT